MSVRDARARFESEAPSQRASFPPKAPLRAVPPPRQVKENWVPTDSRSPPLRSNGPNQPSPVLRQSNLPPRHQESQFNPALVRIPLSPRVIPSPRAFSPTPTFFSSPKLQGTPCRKQSPSQNKNPPRLKPALSPLVTRSPSPSSCSSRPLISPPFASIHSPDLSVLEICERARPTPVKKLDLPRPPPAKAPPKIPECRSSSRSQQSTPSDVWRSFAQSPPKRFSPELKRQDVVSPKRSKATPSPIMKHKAPEYGFNHEKQISAADRLAQIKGDYVSRDKGTFSPSVSGKSAAQMYDELKQGFAKKLARDREERMQMMAELSIQADERKAIEKANLYFNHHPVEGVLTVVPHGKLKGLKAAKKRFFSLHLQTRTLSYWKEENLRSRAPKILDQVVAGEASPSQAATFCVRFSNRPAIELKAGSQREAQRWLDALDLIKTQNSPSKPHRKSSSSGNDVTRSNPSFSSEKRGSVEYSEQDDAQVRQIRGAFRDAFRFQLVSSGNKPKTPSSQPPRTPVVFALGSGS